uniref:Putative ovule protein n=1 Tax=Solanum chacoense TaxID=4108 RepID=A0A0V0H733_SOLCH
MTNENLHSSFDCSDVHFIGPKCNDRPNKRKTSNQRISHIYYFYLVEGAFSSFRSGLRKGSFWIKIKLATTIVPTIPPSIATGPVNKLHFL